MPTTVWELACERADATPDALFAKDERGRELTFAGLRDRALRVAAGFAGLGIAEGDVVAWQLPTWIESMVLYGALARLGAVQVPLIPGYRGREVGFILRQSGARMVVVPSVWGGFDFESMAREVAPEGVSVLVLDPAERVLPSGDPAGLAEFVAPAEPPVRWVYYTSGTSGEPKGAKHTDATLLGAVAGMVEMLEPVPEDRNALAFPVAHIGGGVWFCTGLTVGCSQLLAERFVPESTIPYLAAEGATLIGSGTPFNLAYLAAQRARPDQPIFPTVRHFMSGASPKPPHLHGLMQAECGAGICSSYGLTEAPILSACGPRATTARRATTEGHAAAGVTLRIVDGAGRALGVGEEGEVVARGPQMCVGYLDPALDVAFDAEGWFHTGDLGRLDEEGFLTITGRLKDVIIRKGENISAKEIEDLIYEHPGVGDVAVIGLPHPDSGEMACAVVAPAPGAPPLDLAELVAFLRGRQVMTQKIPERLEIVDVLPRNAAGKVMKQELQARYR